MTPRPYQQAAIDHAVAFLRNAGPGDKQLYASPTGSGKTLMQLGVVAELPGGYIISPTDDILAGFAAKIGKPGESKESLERLGYYTPIRLRNQLMKGTVQPPPYLIIDESHHADAETYRLIDLLCADVPAVGFTATPYRGTAKSTAEFRKRWGPAVTIITLQECVKEGYTAFPDCSVIPLMDDDVIEVRNGEFVVEQVNEQCEGVTGRLLGELDRLYGGTVPDRPTMLSMPTVYAADLYGRVLRESGFPVEVVTGETKTRAKAFQRVVDCKATLVQVNVVSEGVDLPLRRCIDMAPTLSPVRFMQGRIGRITRPVPADEPPPEYICTNRNLLRHAYLLEGLLPVAVYKKAADAFPGQSSRRSVRVLGFEGLGRFTTTDIPLHGGLTGTLVAITSTDNGVVTEYAAIASPLHQDVLYAERRNVRKPDGTAYGEWKRIEEIPEITTGFSSLAAREITPAQLRWWVNAARFYGLDKDAVPNTRQFASLPILKQTGFRFRP